MEEMNNNVETEMEKQDRQDRVKRKLLEDQRSTNIFWGLVLIFVGAVWLLNYIVDFSLHTQMEDLIYSWKMILILLGASFIFSRKSITAGVILFAIGTFFMLPDIFYFTKKFWEIFIPSSLIILGVFIIFLRKAQVEVESSLIGYVDVSSIFSSRKNNVTSKSFKGGKIRTVFGSSSIDLRQAGLDSEDVTLDVFTVFGAADLYVPEGWDVKLSVKSIFGSFEDKRILAKREEGIAEKSIIVTGFTLFGSGEIK